MKIMTIQDGQLMTDNTGDDILVDNGLGKPDQLAQVWIFKIICKIVKFDGRQYKEQRTNYL
jgi:hypothetical protein